MSTDVADQVVLKQTLLSVNEVFVYRVPSLKTSGGHRADDWDLANPLQTCELTVARRDNVLTILLMALKPKEGGPPGATEPVLFAQANIDLSTTYPMSYFCDAVVDSSRYFCIRIEDPSKGRSAHFGLGFRERDDASNFRMALQDYEQSLVRERAAEQLHAKYEDTNSGDSGSNSSLSDGFGALTLKEGEKIHIQLKGLPVKEREVKTPKSGVTEVPVASVPLLKKPPPSAAPPPVLGPAISGRDLEMVEKTHLASSKTFEEQEEDGITAGAIDNDSTVDDDDYVDDDEEFEEGVVVTEDIDIDEWKDFQEGGGDETGVSK